MMCWTFFPSFMEILVKFYSQHTYVTEILSIAQQHWNGMIFNFYIIRGAQDICDFFFMFHLKIKNLYYLYVNAICTRI